LKEIETLILGGLTTIPDYAIRVVPFIKDKYFQDDANRILFRVYQEYYDKYKTIPKKEAIAVEVESLTGISLDTHQKAIDRIETIYSSKIQEAIRAQNLDWLFDRTQKYLTDRACFLAVMEAIDILDDVAAKKRLSKYGVSNIIKLQEAYKKIEDKKIDIIKYRSYHLAEDIKKESNKILSKIKTEREIQNKEKNEQVIIDVADVKLIIQEITKIPITDKGLDVKGLKQHLEKKIIGQENAVNSIVKTVMLNKLELDDNEKPIGSFLFIGYSGVGKTELTKEVSRFLSGTENSLIRIDCSEYSQPHEVSKLIGAPAGYIGYEEGGQLTEKVKRNPFSVILFDEIEKAHEKLFDILLQVLGEGRLTDNKGETISFKNTIIIMTSNVGTKNAIKNMSSIGYSKQNAEYEQSIVEKEVKKQFKPEFINRIDNIIHFNILSREAIMTLLDMELNKLKNQVKKHDVELVISNEVKEFLLDENYSIEYGFRPFKRKINDEIKLIIAEVLFEDKPKEIKITIEGKKIKAVF
jgi:ATP-dependent Clp protease ATP-binding subunit ClpC